eukprot:TRINITY_DN19579_c0_g1_i1.p2 TRINITY_DN19579_c0_g1~~TRINITY_DN19579_c0_g1_i1.p2  ORF type:complete len:201 (+),score=51.56 TRINITY_DN19579_c0_g1_i1:79-603(+)
MGNAASPQERGLTHDPAQGGLETPPRGEQLHWTEVHADPATELPPFPACLCGRPPPAGPPNAVPEPEEFAAIRHFLQHDVGKDIDDGTGLRMYCELEGYTDIHPILWRSQAIRGADWEGGGVEYCWCEVQLLPGPKPLPIRQCCFRLDWQSTHLDKPPVVHGFLLPAREQAPDD